MSHAKQDNRPFDECVTKIIPYWFPVKGFMKSIQNPLAEEPCRCRPDLQCYPINCEFCEQIPTCNAGYGLEIDPGENAQI